MTELKAMDETLLKNLRKENPKVKINLEGNHLHIFGDVSRSKLILPNGFFKVHKQKLMAIQSLLLELVLIQPRVVIRFTNLMC